MGFKKGEKSDYIGNIHIVYIVEKPRQTPAKVPPELYA